MDALNSTMPILDDGDSVAITASARPGRPILIAGKPLYKPIAHPGPFVMNTWEEIMQAFRDDEGGAVVALYRLHHGSAAGAV